MDVSGLPPFAQRTHKGWGTRSCVNTQLENAVGLHQSRKCYSWEGKIEIPTQVQRRPSNSGLHLDKHLVEHVGIKDILVAIVYDRPGMVCLRCRTITIASR